MKRIFTFVAFLLCIPFLTWTQEAETDTLKSDSVRVPDPWIHVYRTENGKLRITTAPAADFKGMVYDKSSPKVDGYDRLKYEYIDINGKEQSETIDMSLIDSVEIGTNVPTLFITTDRPLKNNEIESKEIYCDATFELKGFGLYKDIADTAVQIKGRGNSTWSQFPKKPYRLKFPAKIKLCGLKKAKNYALIANYIDCSLVRNAIAFKIGEMLGMPYTNHSIPVNIVLNGAYKGAYQLTEKVGINNGSVDIDETTGILFEFDTNYDEPYKFYSTYYRIPVMVKDPDFKELAALPTAPESDPQKIWDRWRNDFQTFETAVYNGSREDIEKYFDVASLVDFLLVQNVVGNREPGHPKSVYMYKEKADTTYKMGPLWDFDWAFTFDGNYNETNMRPNVILFNKYSQMENFYKRLMEKTDFFDRYKERWAEFKDRLPELWNYIDEYAHTVRPSAAQNGVVWPYDTSGGRNIYSTATFDDNVARMKKFLQDRIDYIDSYRNYGFY